MRFARLALPCSFLLLAVVRPAAAHDPQLSGLRIGSSKDRTSISVTTHLSRLAASEGKQTLSEAEVDAAIRKRLRLRLDGQPYRPGEGTLLRDEPNDLVMWQS